MSPMENFKKENAGPDQLNQNLQGDSDAHHRVGVGGGGRVGS